MTRPGFGRPDGTTIGVRLALFLMAGFLYLGVPWIQPEPRTPGRFMQLAEAFVDGHLSIADPKPNENELIPTATKGRYHCPYPPLPAVLLMPFAVFGVSLRVEFACRAISIANVLLFDSVLRRFPAMLGRPALEIGPRVALDLLFAFGTVTWHNAEMGGDWHWAHAVSMCAMLLALREFAGCKRLGFVGCFVGLSILARPTTGLLALFFVFSVARGPRPCRAVLLTKLVAGPAAAILLLAAYNQFRFGSPTDFGYDRMLLRGAGQRLLHDYGQFNGHFIPINLYWFFLAPPLPLAGGRFPFFGYDPHGLSLFIASPALLYAFVGLRRGWSVPAVRHAAGAIACCLLPLLLYFNTGFWQFGHRFSMDYLPLLMLLVLAGVGTRPSRLAYSLIAISIWVNAAGVIVDPVILPNRL